MSETRPLVKLRWFLSVDVPAQPLCACDVRNAWCRFVCLDVAAAVSQPDAEQAGQVVCQACRTCLDYLACDVPLAPVVLLLRGLEALAGMPDDARLRTITCRVKAGGCCGSACPCEWRARASRCGKQERKTVKR